MFPIFIPIHAVARFILKKILYFYQYTIVKATAIPFKVSKDPESKVSKDPEPKVGCNSESKIGSYSIKSKRFCDHLNLLHYHLKTIKANLILQSFTSTTIPFKVG